MLALQFYLTSTIQGSYPAFLNTFVLVIKGLSISDITNSLNASVKYILWSVTLNVYGLFSSSGERFKVCVNSEN